MDERPARRRHAGPYLVGVTGPIGSGKSLLCRILGERHGAPVIDADAIGHEVIGAGGAARAPVVARFGSRVLGPGDEIDRAALGRVVFGDPQALAALEAATHPAIIAEVRRRVAALKASGYIGIILLDAAVLPGWLDRLAPDALVLVQSAEETRLRRLDDRGLDRDEVRRRMAAQERFFNSGFRADRILENDGSRDELEQAAERLWPELAALLGAPGRDGTP